MNRRDAAVIALRVMGIYAWIRFIQTAPGIVWMLTSRGADAGWDRTPALTVAVGLGPIVLALAGTLLLVLAPRLARPMLGAVDEPENPAPAEHLLGPACAVIGVVLVVTAIPELPRLAYSVSVLMKEARVDWTPKDTRDAWILILQVGLQTGVGLWLFFRGRGLAALWRRLRS